MSDVPMIITCPTDPARVAQLRGKLAEYKARLNAFAAPERQRGTHYKIAVLEAVLAGQADGDAIHTELQVKYGEVSFATLIDVLGVINDYCTTGGANVHNSTGLPSVA
jgi:hypothetical protein